MKVMGEREQYKDSSVFIASKAQIEKFKQRERMMRNMARASTTQEKQHT